MKPALSPSETKHLGMRNWSATAMVGAWLSAMGGAMLSAMTALACCIGPLALAVLGAGGAGLLLKLKPDRPYFVALTLGLVVTGFVLAYWRRADPVVVNGVACACEPAERNRLGRMLLWVAPVVVAALLALPYLAPYLLE